MTTIDNASGSNASESSASKSNSNAITRSLIAEASRMDATHTLFGLHFPLRLEPTVFNMAGMLSEQYQGGSWEFYSLSNGGFYMAPCHARKPDTGYTVTSENGFEGPMSADALGIVACLYAYSHLSFAQNSFGELCGKHYHWLREYALDHSEAGAIFAAID
ncbi:MAG: antirestriction protein [Rhodoferax sp.]